MTGQAYRLGQLAKRVGCSTYKLRRLCETGQIEAELTTKGQWRVSEEECNRLERDGLPPMPTATVEEDDDPPSAKTALSPLEPDSLESDAVREEYDNLQIAEARLKRRRIESDQEDVEDVFREREQRRLEPKLVEQRRHAEAEKAFKLRIWRNRWLTYAANRTPGGCDPTLRIQVHRAAEQILNSLSPDDSDQIITRLIDASVDSSLQPHYRQERLEQAILAAVDCLPIGARYDEAWKGPTISAARKAIAALESGSSQWEVASAVKEAVAPIAHRYEEQQTRQNLLNEMNCWRLFDSNAEEREAAVHTLRNALDAAPRGSSPQELRKIRDMAVQPLSRKIDERKQHERDHAEAERRADLALRHVERHLSANWEFDSWSERSRTEAEFKGKLRPALVKRFLDGRLEDSDDARTYVEDWIDAELDDA